MVPTASVSLNINWHKMFRPGRYGCLARSTLRSIASSSRRTSSFAVAKALTVPTALTQSSSQSHSLALTIHKPWSPSLQRYASTIKPIDQADHKAEEKVANEVIQPHPEEVSIDSSVHQIFHEKATPEEEEDVEMLAGVYSDIVSKPRLMLGHVVGRYD